MEGLGFIHEKLDIKILILYILNHLPAAVDAQTLSDLVFCDNGIGYFDYSDCLAELVDTAHITEEGGKYRITEKGRAFYDFNKTNWFDTIKIMKDLINGGTK